MKTLIILVQTLVLLAAGWFTHPAESDFRGYVHTHMAAKADGLLSREAADAHAQTLLSQCTFRDRILWTEVTKDGQILYIGDLAHWFDRDAIERSDMTKAAFTGSNLK